MTEEGKPKEKTSREKLREKKPKVLDKIVAYESSPPPIIQLQYSYKCNIRCEHCSIDLVRHKDKKTLTIDNVKNIYDQADELGFSRTTISGGEPTIFPDLDQLVEAIGPDRFWIQMDTNCISLTEDLVFHLKEIGVDRIQPSLDSLIEAEHNEFRHSSVAYKKAIEAVDIIKKADLGIFMQTVAGHTRIHSQEFLDYLKFFNDKGVGVFVSFAKPVGAWSGKFDDCITRDDLKFMEELEKKYNVFTHLTPGYGVNVERHCVASKNIFSITAHGEVLPCPYFYASMGNVVEESFKDIYERCKRLKVFRKDTCLLAEDRDFQQKYLVGKIYGNNLPVSWKEVFDENDFEK